MSSTRKMISALALSLCVGVGPVAAGSLDTDVDVTLPSVIALYCFDQIKLDMTGQLANGTLGTTLNKTVAATPGTWTVDADLLGQNTTPPTIRANLTLNGVCAFRALSGSNGVNVSITPLNTVLQGPDGSIIPLNVFRARVPDHSTAWQADVDVPTDSFALSDLRPIDVRMRMNIGGANVAGLYSSPVDGTFRITVIANP